MGSEDHARWVKANGEDELGQLLYWRWDPIDVADDFPWTKGEYHDYAGPLIALLREGATQRQVVTYLREVEVDAMEMEMSSATLGDIAAAVIKWYEGSTTMWDQGMYRRPK